MKRRTGISVFAIALSLAMLAGGISGCGNNSEQGESAPKESQTGGDTTDVKQNQTAGDVAIQWWTPNWDEPESREMAKEFEDANPGVKVNLVITDWDTYKSKITAAISANNAPELSTVLITDIAPFAKVGLAEPLNDWSTQIDMNLDDFIPAALKIATVDDKLYGLPFRYDGSGMYYNVDLLKEAGYEEFPQTWDEFVTMSKKLTKDGTYGFAWPVGHQASAVTRLVQQLYTNGGEVINEDETKCLLDSDQTIAALSNIVDSINEGYASPNSLEYDNTKMRAAFGSGQLAVLFSGPFDVEAIEKEYPDLNFKTAVIPGVDGMGVTTANGWSLMLAAKSSNKEWGAKFLAYLTLPENQIRLTDSFPASKTALQDPKFSTEYLIPFAKQLDHSKAEPSFKVWPEVEPIIYSYIQQAVAGSTSVEDACKAMTQEVDMVLNQ